MNICLEIWDDESTFVTYYGVRKEGAELNETDRFLLKYEKDERYKEAVQQLVSLLLNDIGERFGAKRVFFNRDEEGAFGLPPRGKIRVLDEGRVGYVELHYPEFPLRLYAMQVAGREDLVVLFGGGAKTSQKNIDSKGLHVAMQEAKMFARKIDLAIRSGEIRINGRKRCLEGDEEEIVLY
ncbi:MAG: hypothetical protein MUC87_13030 [Bacteroidia bacterium]|nr:hypothetical protein [Bacteroidia bacterium]